MCQLGLGEDSSEYLKQVADDTNFHQEFTDKNSDVYVPKTTILSYSLLSLSNDTFSLVI